MPTLFESSSRLVISAMYLMPSTAYAHLIRILFPLGDLCNVLNALHGPAQLWTAIAA
jgi:hypothetical protein